MGQQKISTTTVREELNKDIPDDYIPIAKQEDNTHAIHIHHQYHPIQKQIIQTCNEYIDNLPLYEKEMIKTPTIHNMSDLIEHITNDKTLMIYVATELLKGGYPEVHG